MRTVLLLTGCVRPDGMPYTQLTDVDVRRRQYMDAIDFYLEQTDCPVVFCENSQTDLSSAFAEHPQCRRLECLTFRAGGDNQRGKGYGEVEIIGYAFKHARALREPCTVVKITGRLMVTNIAAIVRSLTYRKDFVTCLMHSDLSFADSRVFCGSTAFYRELLEERERVNDSQGVFLEHVLRDVVMASPIAFRPFEEEPLITGMSGTTGETYVAPQHSVQHQRRYRIYAYRQWQQINRQSTNRHVGFVERCYITMNTLKYRLIAKYL